jgi:predicted PurR-regulated permease PerM
MQTKLFGFYFLLFIIFALAVKFYIIITVFLPAIASACVFAYLFNPIYKNIYKITKIKPLSALIIIFLIFSIVFVPFMLIIIGIQKEISLIFTQETYTFILNSMTNIQKIVYERFSIDISNITNIIQTQMTGAIQGAITVLGPKILFSITGFAFSTFITFFVMYYILTGSDAVISTFIEYFPLSKVNCDKLLREVSLQTKALVLGQILIAILQGTLTGIGLLIFGIPGALLWGAVTVIMSFIPILGTMIIWFPAGLIQLSQHDYFSGIGILLWGGLLVGNIDNIVRPKLTSALGKIHPVTVLLGVIIGIKEWGFIGLVIGPLIITILLVLIRMFREEYEEKPKTKRKIIKNEGEKSIGKNEARI